MKKVLYLEKAVERYKLKFGMMPKNLDKLVAYGIIKGIPSDPYGGKFYLDRKGSIKTSSKLAFEQKDLVPKQRNQ